MNLAGRGTRRDHLYTVICVFIAFSGLRALKRDAPSNAAIAKECCNRHQPQAIRQA
jgi:hypothetical protein